MTSSELNWRVTSSELNWRVTSVCHSPVQLPATSCSWTGEWQLRAELESDKLRAELESDKLSVELESDKLSAEPDSDKLRAGRSNEVLPLQWECYRPALYHCHILCTTAHTLSTTAHTSCTTATIPLPVTTASLHVKLTSPVLLLHYQYHCHTPGITATSPPPLPHALYHCHTPCSISSRPVPLPHAMYHCHMHVLYHCLTPCTIVTSTSCTTASPPVPLPRTLYHWYTLLRYTCIPWLWKNYVGLDKGKDKIFYGQEPPLSVGSIIYFSNVTEVTQWAATSCSRLQSATDDGVSDGRANWLAATPTLKRTVPRERHLHSASVALHESVQQPEGEPGMFWTQPFKTKKKI